MPRKPTDVACWLAEDHQPSPDHPNRVRRLLGLAGAILAALGWSVAMAYLANPHGW